MAQWAAESAKGREVVQNASNAAQSANVTTDDGRARGKQINKRMRALGISIRQFYVKTGIDRRTLQRAIAGLPSVKDNTYDQIETWLDRLEAQAKTFEGLPEDEGEDDEIEPEFVELRIEGDFGVRVVVRGPVRDRAELEASALRLMRELRAEREEPK